MLTDAIKTVKDLVFEDEYQNKSDEAIQNELNEISSVTEIEVGTLATFFNYFSGLKMEMDRRGITTTKNLDWTNDQVAIMMVYMEERKREKMGVEDAFNNLATVLDKTKSGVQYKFYETKKAQKAPKKPQKTETRGRKKKNVSNNLTGIKGGKKEEQQKTPLDIDVDERTEEKVVAFATQQSVEESQTYNESFNPIEEDYSTELVPAKSTRNYRSAPTEDEGEVDIADLITGMIQDFGQIEKTRSSGTSTYKTILDLFKGLRALSSLAASNASEAQENEVLKEEARINRTRMAHLDNENLELMKQYNKMATTIQEFNELDQVQRLGQWKNYMQTVAGQVSKAGGVPEPSKKKYLLDKNLTLSVH